MKTLFFLALLSVSQVHAAKTVRFNGHIDPTSLSRLEQNIQNAIRSLRPQDERVIIVELSSGGGELQPAVRFANSMSQMGTYDQVQIYTKVSRSCESSCTVLFTGGSVRIAKRGARFGFHSPKIESALPRDLSRDYVLNYTRDLWLNAIHRVDSSFAYQLDRSGALLRENMRYFRASELTSGYVSHLE